MALRFEPPGPGSWELDPVHFPRPVTRYWTEIHPEALRRGVQDFTRFYGRQLHDWDEKIKPTSLKAHRELQSVDPEELSDEDLITHLTCSRNHHGAMLSQHMRFTARRSENRMLAPYSFLAKHYMPAGILAQSKRR
jgi:pyruvate,water dikinase